VLFNEVRVGGLVDEKRLSVRVRGREGVSDRISPLLNESTLTPESKPLV
jgi:hypothetical protein